MSEDRILLTGSSGLIGTSLVRSLMRKRISMVSLVRHPLPETRARYAGSERVSSELWDPYSATPVSPAPAVQSEIQHHCSYRHPILMSLPFESSTSRVEA